jgi:hypothetical protein
MTKWCCALRRGLRRITCHRQEPGPEPSTIALTNLQGAAHFSLSRLKALKPAASCGLARAVAGQVTAERRNGPL